MSTIMQALSILDKFNFQIPPVGVKFMVNKPENIDRLDKKLPLCEMVTWAQKGNVFYADQDNQECGGGKHVVGGKAEEVYTSGMFGAGLEIFDGTRSASRLYQYLPTIQRGVVNYIAFAPLQKLPFEPDVLVIVANIDQAEILLRASTYRTGKIWTSKWSAAIGCAWMLIYPYLTGELNYGTTGLGHGMKRKKLFPANTMLISIPFDLMASILQTLQEMPWVLPAYKPDGSDFVKKLCIDLGITPRP